MKTEIDKWIMEVRADWGKHDEAEDDWVEEAWDDVKGGELKVEDVRKARREEVYPPGTRVEMNPDTRARNSSIQSLNQIITTNLMGVIYNCGCI